MSEEKGYYKTENLLTRALAAHGRHDQSDQLLTMTYALVDLMEQMADLRKTMRDIEWRLSHPKEDHDA